MKKILVSLSIIFCFASVADATELLFPKNPAYRLGLTYDIEKEYKVTINLGNEQEVKCKYQLIRVEKGDNGLYTISGRFTNLSNIDKMTLIQFCMKKDMENQNK